MPDDNKTPAPPPRPDGDQKSQPNAPQTGQSSVENLPTKADEKPATPAPPPKAVAPAQTPAGKPAAAAPGASPAGAPAKPAAPPKAAGPVPVPWDSEMVKRLKQRYGSGIRESSSYLGQNYMIVDRTLIHEILQLLCEDEQFDYCVDVTAVHYPQREQQFDVVWILYSFARNERIRVKTLIRETETVPSSVDIWTTANWLERECYDMFGISFEGHPDLRRILLPDGWKGHPLRKDYGIIQQDKEWVQINLGIESGQ